MASRPILISIIAILTFIAGLLTILLGLGIASLGGEVALGVGTIGLIFGVILIIIGVGMWKGWKPIWYLGVIIYLLYLIFLLYSIATAVMDGADVVGELAGNALILIICILMLIYMFRPKVKEFFGVGK